jgi:two-component system LytT family response regulator
MISTLIVENEKQHSDYLNNLLLKHYPETKVLAVCNTVADGIEKIKTSNPQLIFLDVELDYPNTGFDLLESCRPWNFTVIFTTSYNQYAAKAFRFCALDYIEKPFGADDLKEAMQRFKALPAHIESATKIDALLYNVRQTNHAMDKIGIPILKGIEFIRLDEIIFCKADDNCTIFYLTDKRKIVATKTLKWVEELLREHDFFRVHDSYLINLHHITRYVKGGEGGVAELTDRYEADVSRKRKKDFLKLLADLKMIHY